MSEENQSNQENAAAGQGQTPQFNIQRIYTKDISFESPNAPGIFTKEWKPEIKLDIDTSTDKLDGNLFEVVLSVTVTATMGEETAFLCEVEQAGIFMIGDMPEQNKAHTCWVLSVRTRCSHMLVKPFLTWLIAVPSRR